MGIFEGVIMKNNKILAVILFCLLIGAFFLIKSNFTTNKIDDKTSNINLAAKIKSANLSTDYTIDQALSDIDKFSLNTLNVPIVINIENLAASTMTIDEASKEKAITLIKRLNRKGINVILEPYPWIANGSEYETDWKPRDINTFFWHWKTNVLKVLIDDVAVPYQVDVLNIGTGFNHMEYATGYWCDTIDYVRKHYQGLVTYRSSWWITADWDIDTLSKYEDKINNEFFSKLDFISIAAYFELTNNDSNSVENLISALESTQIFDRKQNVKQEIKKFHQRWKKPIFLGELGFPRTIKASIHPWDPYQSTVIANTEQANCFEAYRQVFESEPWLMGFSVFAIGEHSDDKWYYPSDESAAVIRSWYSD